jgi:hypothetical protein
MADHDDEDTARDLGMNECTCVVAVSILAQSALSSTSLHKTLAKLKPAIDVVL